MTVIGFGDRDSDNELAHVRIGDWVSATNVTIRPFESQTGVGVLSSAVFYCRSSESTLETRGPNNSGTDWKYNRSTPYLTVWPVG
jgi:hypothetical protein